MKTLNCKDVGDQQCNWGAKAETDEELLSMAAKHAREAHGITEFNDALKNEVRSKIVDRKAA